MAVFPRINCPPSMFWGKPNNTMYFQQNNYGMGFPSFGCHCNHGGGNKLLQLMAFSQMFMQPTYSMLPYYNFTEGGGSASNSSGAATSQMDQARTFLTQSGYTKNDGFGVMQDESGNIVYTHTDENGVVISGKNLKELLENVNKNNKTKDDTDVDETQLKVKPSKEKEEATVEDNNQEDTPPAAEEDHTTPPAPTAPTKPVKPAPPAKPETPAKTNNNPKIGDNKCGYMQLKPNSKYQYQFYDKCTNEIIEETQYAKNHPGDYLNKVANTKKWYTPEQLKKALETFDKQRYHGHLFKNIEIRDEGKTLFCDFKGYRGNWVGSYTINLGDKKGYYAELQKLFYDLVNCRL